MSHTYISNLVHCVFSTKNRCNLISPEVQPDLWAFLGGIARKNGFKALIVGGIEPRGHEGDRRGGRRYERIEGDVRPGLAAVFDDSTQWILTGNAWNYRSVVDDHGRLTEAFRRSRDEMVAAWEDRRKKASQRAASAPNTASPSPRDKNIPDSF